MKSLNNNRPIQTPSFWDQLENDIDKIGNRAKDKLMKYQFKQYQTIKNNNPQSKPLPVPQIKLNIKKPYKSSTKLKEDVITSQSISTLDRRALQKLEKEQSDKKLLMKNRLMYLKQDKQKHFKTVQMAKRKFQLITTVRNQSFRQKQSIRKRIMSIDQEVHNEKLSLANEVRTSRQKRNLSLQSYRSLVQEGAQKRRNQSLHNQSITVLQKAKVKQQNAKKVSLTKKDMERSRSIVSQAKQRKIHENKNYHKHQLTTRLKNLTVQKKNNQQIFAKLQQQTEKIGRWRSRAQKQIEQYRSYLGLSTKNSVMLKNSFKDSEKSVKSFYITHF